MKKLLLLLLIVIFIASFNQNALAQLGPSWGVKGGMVWANLDMKGNDVMEFDKKTGFAGGLFFKFSLLNILMFQPEVYYIQKGAQKEYSDSEGNLTFTTSLDYIEVPVLFKLGIFSLPMIHPHIFGGPSFSFLVNAKTKTEYMGQSEEEDIKDQFNNNDTGFVIGAGVDLNLVFGTILVDFRYIKSTKNIYKGEDSEGLDVKNKVYMLSVGIGL